MFAVTRDYFDHNTSDKLGGKPRTIRVRADAVEWIRLSARTYNDAKSCESRKTKQGEQWFFACMFRPWRKIFNAVS